MTDAPTPSAPSEPTRPVRTFLVVVDQSEEMRAALRFACKRARNTGGQVALLHVIEPAEFQHFATIGKIMSEEARAESEELLQRLAAEVNRCSEHVPILYVREGKPDEDLIKLVDEEPSISILVLAAGTGPDGPGPLVSGLSGKLGKALRIPVTVVPGELTDDQIDVLA
ncbi:MAG: universal stress protein [Rhodospirillaceae bacterium]